MKTPSNDLDSLAHDALLCVYQQASLNRPVHAGSVAAALGISPSQAARILLALDARGLLWAERCTLTMLGLSISARLSARGQSQRAARASQESKRRAA